MVTNLNSGSFLLPIFLVETQNAFTLSRVQLWLRMEAVPFVWQQKWRREWDEHLQPLATPTCVIQVAAKENCVNLHTQKKNSLDFADKYEIRVNVEKHSLLSQAISSQNKSSCEVDSTNRIMPLKRSIQYCTVQYIIVKLITVNDHSNQLNTF